jgi:hypothetical protein
MNFEVSQVIFHTVLMIALLAALLQVRWTRPSKWRMRAAAAV